MIAVVGPWRPDAPTEGTRPGRGASPRAGRGPVGRRVRRPDARPADRAGLSRPEPPIRDRRGGDGRRSCDLRDPRALVDATVLTVLSRQYLDQARRFAGNSDEPEDWYGVKARATKAELDDLLDRLVLRWNSLTDASQSAPSTRFSTRLSR